MGWPTRTSALPIGDLRQIAYLLPMWGGIWSGVVFLWRRLICPQNNSLRMFWYRDLNSSHFFPRFGLLEHEANRTPDISATFIGSHKKFCKHNRMSVCPARKRKPSISSVSYRLNRFNRSSRGRTTPLQILCQNMVRTWYIRQCRRSLLFLNTERLANLHRKLVAPKIPLHAGSYYSTRVRHFLIYTEQTTTPQERVTHGRRGWKAEVEWNVNWPYLDD